MHPDTNKYNDSLNPDDRRICELLAREIDKGLPEAENKIWHASPVWFLDGKPVAGYGKLKSCVRLLFWSGQSFEEEGLKPVGSFKAAEARYTSMQQADDIRLKAYPAEITVSEPGRLTTALMSAVRRADQTAILSCRQLFKLREVVQNLIPGCL